MRGYLCVTGTPGTGKKTIAPLVAARLRIPCFGLNDLAARYGLQVGQREVEVNAAGLGRRLRKEVDEPCLLFGHLVPYALRKQDVARVAVLRCDPRVLRARLTKRGYPMGKMIENVEAELIGVISADSAEAFGRSKVVEFDTSTTSPGKAAAEIARLLSPRGAGSGPIDWLRSYDSPEKLKSLLLSGTAYSALM